MNQGRIWCVVHPTVGLPLLLGSVALTSLAVHTAVMTHTTWMGNYWMGSARIRVTDTAAPPKAAVASQAVAPQGGAPFSVTMTSVPAGDAKSPASFVITVTPTAAVATAADGPAKPAPVAVSLQAANAH